MNHFHAKELLNRFLAAKAQTTEALIEREEAKQAKEASKWSRLIGDKPKYSKGTYALRCAYAEQALRMAVAAEAEAEKNYLLQLELEMQSIMQEDDLLFGESFSGGVHSCRG